MNKEKRNLLKKLAHTCCRLKPSKKNGVGVFAIRNIAGGENPFFYRPKTKWLKFKPSEIKKLPPEIKRMIKEFYGTEDGGHYIPDHGLEGNNISFFLNHSHKPNVKSEGLEFKTLRKIKKGEELVINYKDYDPEDNILKG